MYAYRVRRDCLTQWLACVANVPVRAKRNNWPREGVSHSGRAENGALASFISLFFALAPFSALPECETPRCPIISFGSYENVCYTGKPFARCCVTHWAENLSALQGIVWNLKQRKIKPRNEIKCSFF